MMFICIKEAKFLKLVKELQAYPHSYLNFDSVADFYQAEWLNSLPEEAEFHCSGLDDGAEEFDIVIQYLDHLLTINIGSIIKVNYKKCIS